MGLGFLALFAAPERERVANRRFDSATAPMISLVITAIFLRELEAISIRIVVGAAIVICGGFLIVGV